MKIIIKKEVDLVRKLALDLADTIEVPVVLPPPIPPSELPLDFWSNTNIISNIAVTTCNIKRNNCSPSIC